jgi:hypothetical protein
MRAYDEAECRLEVLSVPQHSKHRWEAPLQRRPNERECEPKGCSTYHHGTPWMEQALVSLERSC